MPPFPKGLDQIKIVYGDIKVVNGQVVSPRDWESEHMILVKETWLPKGKLYVNKYVWPSLKACTEQCLALKDGYTIRTLGCFAPRLKRVNGELSTHSWGIAVDLNADTNPLSMDGVLRTDIPAAWIKIFEDAGATWGGRFKKPDAMHVQFCAGY